VSVKDHFNRREEKKIEDSISLDWLMAANYNEVKFKKEGYHGKEKTYLFRFHRRRTADFIACLEHIHLCNFSILR
jgi:hypothetical protein